MSTNNAFSFSRNLKRVKSGFTKTSMTRKIPVKCFMCQLMKRIYCLYTEVWKLTLCSYYMQKSYEKKILFIPCLKRKNKILYSISATIIHFCNISIPSWVLFIIIFILQRIYSTQVAKKCWRLSLTNWNMGCLWNLAERTEWDRV